MDEVTIVECFCGLAAAYAAKTLEIARKQKNG
jgi:hypothetical protein